MTQTKHQVTTITSGSLLGIAEYARKQEITHLWLLPDSLEVGASEYNLPPGEWDSLPNWQYTPQIAKALKRNTLCSVYTYKREGCERHPVNITWLKHSKWAWNTPGVSPTEVYQRVNLLERLLGVSIAGSPSGVGMRYLRTLLRNDKHSEWLQAPKYDLASIPWDKAASPLIWQRTPTAEELARGFVIAIDKNAAFPKAAKNVKMGTGEPTHLDQYGAALAWLAAAPPPGIWQVSVSEGRAIHANDPIEWELLPSVIPPKSFDMPIWLTTPMLRLLKTRGHKVQFHEAWIFEHSAYVWRKWAENLWGFRQLYPAGSWERESFKQIMNDTLGLLRSNKFGSGDRFRPDHNALIVGDSNAVMQYNAQTFATRGAYPIACMIDCLYYLADSEDIERAIPGSLDNAGSLGGYKKKWVIEMDSNVRELLAGELPLNKKLELLNKVAAQRGL